MSCETLLYIIEAFKEITFVRKLLFLLVFLFLHYLSDLEVEITFATIQLQMLSSYIKLILLLRQLELAHEMWLVYQSIS